MDPNTVLFAVAGGVVAVLFAGILILLVLRTPPGNERMKEIAAAIQEGASAYLNRQYTVIAIIGIIIAIAIGLAINWKTAALYVVGAVLSAAAGYVGMNIAVRSNLRTAEAARGGLNQALQVAFRGGSVTGFMVVGLGLLGVAGAYYVFKDPNALVGLAFGASLVSVFARLGGGIYTKAADVGADLVGKVEAGIPEDDPRNPAVIADNVGDNVGDCAGMAADLFETYAVTAVAVIVIGGVAIIASIIGTFAVRTKSDNVERALLQGLAVSGVIAAAAFAPITYWLMNNLTFLPSVTHGAIVPKWWHLYLCSLIGIGVTALLFGLTEYYTSTRFNPVKKTAKASVTGHATNIIQGFSSGLQATALPALVLVFGIFGAWKLAGGGTTGIYGVGVAVMGQLSLTGLIVALDAFGPITDNAGGIAEMAELPEEVRNVTDPLDAVGNTTKAVTKGYAIGSAVLAAVVLFAGFRQELADKSHRSIEALSFGINEPPVLIGLLLGGLMVRLFASLSIEAVGRAGGAVVEEVRRQFREHPGIMEGTEEPDYATCVDIVTKTAQREMILPSLLPIGLPVIVGLIDQKALGGLLIGVIVVGFFFAVLMTAGGGAWDNAKKLIEDGAFGGKGSDAHAASVTGDTVGDPFKDTAGPAINPMIKVANIVAILIIPLIT